MNYNIEVIQTPRYCYINAISNDTNERIGKVCIDLNSEDSNRYKCQKKLAKIILVWTSFTYLGKGIATALLNKTVETLNDYSLYLNVVPVRRNDKDKDKNELIRFYSKFGFKRYKEDICTVTMIKY